MTIQRDMRPFIGNGLELYIENARLPIVTGSLFLIHIRGGDKYVDE